ncbi:MULTISPECIES: acyl-CoA dehydrogenase family protein [Acidithrix]|uniref:Acyl-CoA dehydrogenase n=1 Tax=Acidithrix ferrooxidans TaxID=1280514 RepID=A0A0D8HIX0_9ACTN|nr:MULTISPECIES: acyl-CoA dehydrogenase family protein [Acidithrix]KJF17814.1 acyl-CoA dehydrogenase [Acidithrix ferrooxidans]CAG4925158.1 unnamed protein product [Acidithrix sp. C25]
MNFAFSEEQEELRKSVRRFMEDKSPTSSVRAQMETQEGYDREVWDILNNQLGLCSLAIPEEFGGAGFGPLELTVVFEEMGRALFCGPYFSSVALGANAILQSDDEVAKADLLPSIASGETLVTLAITEGDGRWDLDGISTTATAIDSSWVINGEKRYVIDGSIADKIIVVARTTDGISMLVVESDAPNMTITPIVTLDSTRKMATIEFNGTPARLIGTQGASARAIETTLDLAGVALAAEQVGGASRCLEMAVDYAKSRIQFGRPIGSFQAIKHKCADVLLEVESAKSAAYYAAWAASEQNEEFEISAPLAKAFCSDAYFKAAAENIQIHGGIGFTWEHDAHLYFKRAKASQLLFGDSSYHRERLAQKIGL